MKRGYLELNENILIRAQRDTAYASINMLIEIIEILAETNKSVEADYLAKKVIESVRKANGMI